MKILLTALLIAASSAMQAQERRRSLGSYTMYEQIIYQAKQERIMEWLADDMSEGRATGTDAGMSTARFIEVLYRQYGLEPLFSSSFYQPFIADSLSGSRGRNVVGIVRSEVSSDEYVLISAHYDHLGILNGNVYNGADDNASGVTVLLNLADMLGTMKKTGTGPDKNIIFAALDAKELSMAGSKALVRRLLVTNLRDSIICAINIDQIGTVLEPVHKADTNFVIVLGENTLHREHRGLIDMCNRYFDIDLDIDHTFYGSKNFTELFYQLSDQIVFHRAGIPALPPHLLSHHDAVEPVACALLHITGTVLKLLKIEKSTAAEPYKAEYRQHLHSLSNHPYAPHTAQTGIARTY